MLDLSRFDPVLDCQRVFRLILGCMARPGKIELLVPEKPDQATDRAMVMIAMSLLDEETTFAVLGEGEEQLARCCRLIAGGRMVPPEQADFVFVSGAQARPEITGLRRGSLFFPDQGATVVCRVEMLLPETRAGEVCLRLQGPGVQGEVFLGVAGLARENLAYLCEANAEFPLGVDIILVSDCGQVACIPRSASIDWE